VCIICPELQLADYVPAPSWTHTYQLQVQRPNIIPPSHKLQLHQKMLRVNWQPYRRACNAVITIAIRLRYDYNTTTIWLRCIVHACFQFDTSKKWTCQFFVVVVSWSYCSRTHIVISITSIVVEYNVASSYRSRIVVKSQLWCRLNLRAGYGTISFLSSCVPDLSLYRFILHLNTPVVNKKQTVWSKFSRTKSLTAKNSLNTPVLHLHTYALNEKTTGTFTFSLTDQLFGVTPG